MRCKAICCPISFIIESRDSCLLVLGIDSIFSACDGRAWKVDGRAQALVGPGLATPLL